MVNEITIKLQPPLYEGKSRSIFQLTLCILMDFHIQINAIRMRVSIIYFKESQVETSKLCCSSVPKDRFYFSIQRVKAMKYFSSIHRVKGHEIFFQYT